MGVVGSHNIMMAKGQHVTQRGIRQVQSRPRHRKWKVGATRTSLRWRTRCGPAVHGRVRTGQRVVPTTKELRVPDRAFRAVLRAQSGMPNVPESFSCRCNKVVPGESTRQHVFGCAFTNVKQHVHARAGEQAGIPTSLPKKHAQKSGPLGQREKTRRKTRGKRDHGGDHDQAAANQVSTLGQGRPPSQTSTVGTRRVPTFSKSADAGKRDRRPVRKRVRLERPRTSQPCCTQRCALQL